VAAARVVFHPGASKDYAAAFAWYYARGTALASDFEREIDRGIRLVFRNPLAGLSLMTKDDVSLFANFPIQSFMSCTVNDVVILAVAHGKRRSNYWRERSADE
jgi:plasmid stabilization system protein ParE